MDRMRRYRRKQARPANVVLCFCGIVFLYFDLLPLSFVCLFGIVGNLLWTGTRLGEQMVFCFFKEQGDRAEFESFMDTAELVPGIWLDEKYFAGVSNGRAVFGCRGDILWVYQKEKVGSTIYFEILSRITDASHTLVVCCKDQKIYHLRLHSRQDGKRVLQMLEAGPGSILVGYSEENGRKYREFHD